MDYYKKQRVNNVILFLVFVLGIILQFIGHSKTGYKALGIQFVSLILLVLVLYLYNRRHA